MAKLLGILTLTEVDTTLFFRQLMECVPGKLPANALPDTLNAAFYTPGDLPPVFVSQLREWLLTYALRLKSEGVSDEDRRRRMAAANPCIIPRNYLLQEAINDASTGDLGRLQHLLAAIRDPYTAHPAYQSLMTKRPDWARNAPGCSALSCSS